jgi:uncharacterized cupin superfamily protein
MTNIWAHDWDLTSDQPGFGARAKRLPRGERLGASVYEVPPGDAQVPYHFHHGMEELLVVLRGRPTLRTPEGERTLEEGEVVHFPVGPDGAHQVINRTDEPLRYLFISTQVTPEVVEYPDSGKVGVMAKTGSQRGERLVSIHRLDDAVDYFEGESPR